MNVKSRRTLSVCALFVGMTFLTAAIAAAGGRAISGIVTDADGRLASVDVKLLQYGTGKTGPTQLPPGGNPTGDARIGCPDANPLQVGKNEIVVQEKKADAQGKFKFESVEPGRYTILAGTGKQAVRVEIMVKEDVDPPSVTLRLHKG